LRIACKTSPGPYACIRIGEAQTKGKDARVFPIAHAPELLALLLGRWRARTSCLSPAW